MAKHSDEPKLLALPDIGNLSPKQLAIGTFNKFVQHDIATKAAAIAFYSMLAMVPLLTVVLTLFTHLLGYVGQEIALKNAEQSAAIKLFQEAISKLMPGSAYEIVESQIVRLSDGLSATLISLSLVFALWTASSVFATICKTMDQIYAHPEQRTFWRLRYAAFIIMLSVSSVLIISLFVFFIWPIFEFSISLSWAVASILQWLLMSVVVLISFSLLLHIGPSGPRNHPFVTPGAIFATPVFLLATWVFRLYVSKLGTYHQMYGPLGGVMILLLWFWIVGAVLLTGAAIDSVVVESRDKEPHA